MILQIELQNQEEINQKRNQLPQEATVKNILNTFENTKKVIIMLFPKMARYGKIGQIVQGIVQKINIQTQTLNQTIQTTQTNQKIQTTFPIHTIKKEDTLQIVNSTQTMTSLEKILLLMKNSQTTNNKLIPTFM